MNAKRKNRQFVKQKRKKIFYIRNAILKSFALKPGKEFTHNGRENTMGKAKIYTNCKTKHTGLYKPHTIYLDSFGVSIVYYSKRNLQTNNLVAIAFDCSKNKYEIYKTQSIYGNIGFLAFPVNPEKINGIYPYL